MKMQLYSWKLIFTRKIFDLASFWKWEFYELEMAIVLILQEACYNPLRVLLIVYYYDWINLLHFRSTRTFSLNPYRNLYYG